MPISSRAEIGMFKCVQPPNGQVLGIAENLSADRSMERVDRLDSQTSIDHAGFLQFCDVPPDRDKPASP